MKLLVFGRSGQVAQELQRACPSDWDMQAVGRDVADLCDPSACAGVIRAAEVDAVINAAAFTGVDQAETEEPAAMRVNAAAPTAMAQAAAARGLPFLHVSTDYVFDGSGILPRKPEERGNPINAYGRSKLAGEEGVRAAGGSHVILRTSWVFSAWGNNFVKTMLRLGLEREKLRIVCDQIGGPTPAVAVAQALLTMARDLSDRPEVKGTYHLSGTPNASWADFAREIFLQAGLTCDVEGIATADYPTPAARPLNSRLDCSASESVFAIQQPDWRSDLSQVLQELRAK